MSGRRKKETPPIVPDYLHDTDSKYALVLTYNEVARDPRARNQIRWLTELGYIVYTIGRGTPPSGVADKRHLRLRRWPLPLRMLAYVALPNRARFTFLVDFWLQRILNRPLPVFDIIVANTIDFLPWVDGGCPGLAPVSYTPHSRLVVDLHEFSLDQGSGLAYRVLFARYQAWLCTFIASAQIDSRTTVSSGIAELYASALGITPPTLIRNVPPYEDLKPTPVHAPIELVHHGKADSGRNLELTINAMRLCTIPARLTLMLVGEQREITRMKLQCRGLEDRVRVIPGVPMKDVAKSLNEFDVEIIHFPPTTINLKYVLPNKLFESIQGRLGLVVGPSPELAQLVESEKIGVVAAGWSAEDLADAINTLTPQTVLEYKHAAHQAATRLNLDVERDVFKNVVESA